MLIPATLISYSMFSALLVKEIHVGAALIPDSAPGIYENYLGRVERELKR